MTPCVVRWAGINLIRLFRLMTAAFFVGHLQPLTFGVATALAQTLESPTNLRVAEQPGTPGQKFTIVGTRIIGPDGNEFVPIGGNANGPYSWWNDATIGMSATAQKWHWNTLRLITCWPGGCPKAGGWSWDTNNDLDGIIQEYTAKKIVIMISLHQFTGADSLSAADASTLVTFWTDLANKYKNNTYVWFNIANEPVTGGDSSFSDWLEFTEPSVQAIRATGADNIIVVDGSMFGQEAADWSCGEIPYTDSAILAFGPRFRDTYGNILPSVHTYGVWGGGTNSCTTTQLNTRMNEYFDRIASANLPIVIGETGDCPDGPSCDAFWNDGQYEGTETTFRIAPGRRIGILWWSASGGSGYFLTSGGWEGINYVTPPDGLSDFGKLLYNYGLQVNP